MEDNYWTGTFRRRMSRRGLLKGLALGGAGMALLSPALGCQQESAKPAADQPKVSEPKYGGTLVHWNAWNPPTLDPLLNVSAQSHKVLASVYNGLLRYDFKDTTKVIPDLAEKWEVSPDGLTYKFSLRKDVQWQDGKPFTAADCQTTYDRLKDKAFVSKSTRWGKPVMRIIDSWKTIDDYTFQVNFKSPVPYILNFLASNVSAITPRHILEKDGNMEKTWVGTGPFKLVKYEPGAVIELVKNPNFFRKGLPYLDGIKRPVIQDRAAQVAALASGQTMLGLQWPAFAPSEVDLIKKQLGDKVTVVNSFQNGCQRLNFQPGHPPMNDVKVRRAVFLAIDRWDIAERVSEGTGEIGTIIDSRIFGDWALPLDEVQKMPGIRKDKTEDIAMAKKLLAEAGYPNGFEVVLKVRNTENYVPVATVAAAQLKKIGLDVKLVSLDPNSGTTELNNGEWQMGSTGGNNAGWFHALSGLISYVEPTNYTKYYVPWAPKEFTAMLDEAMVTLDVARAKKLCHDMQRYLLTKDAPMFPINWNDALVVVSSKLHGFAAPNWGMNEGHDHTVEWLEP